MQAMNYGDALKRAAVEPGELEEQADAIDKLAVELRLQAALMRSEKSLPTGLIKGVLQTLNHAGSTLSQATGAVARVYRRARLDPRR